MDSLRPVVGAWLGRSTRRMDGSPVPQLRNVHARVARTQVIDTPCFVCVLCVEAAAPPTTRNSLRSERNINIVPSKAPLLHPIAVHGTCLPRGPPTRPFAHCLEDSADGRHVEYVIEVTADDAEWQVTPHGPLFCQRRRAACSSRAFFVGRDALLRDGEITQDTQRKERRAAPSTAEASPLKRQRQGLAPLHLSPSPPQRELQLREGLTGLRHVVARLVSSGPRRSTLSSRR